MSVKDTACAVASGMAGVRDICSMIGSFKAMVVILSPSCLASEELLEAIWAAVTVAGVQAVPVAMSGFRFMSPKDLTDLWAGRFSDESQNKFQVTLHNFFKSIAVAFNTHASENILTATVEEVVARLATKSCPAHQRVIDAMAACSTATTPRQQRSSPRTPKLPVKQEQQAMAPAASVDSDMTNAI